MSDREFETYLSLLAKLLRLSPSQRAEVADEVRDHLEEHVALFVGLGLSREEAVRRALEEFGDVAALARGLSAPRTLRRRRLVLRSVVGALAACVVAFLFWPQGANRPGPMPMPGPAVAVAQLGGGESSEKRPTLKLKPSAAEARRLAVEAKLDEPNGEMTFSDTPLRDVVEFVSTRLETPILLDRKRLDEIGVSDDSPVTFTLDADKMSERSALELILADQKLAHFVREGAILVTTDDEEMERLHAEVRVYDCRDLLDAGRATQTGGADGAAPGPMGGFGGGAPAMAAGAAAGGMGGAVGAGGGYGGAPIRSTHPAGSALLDVIVAMTGGHWKEIDGSGGELREFGGQVIVLQHPRIHRKIEDLLAKMRAGRAKM